MLLTLFYSLIILLYRSVLFAMVSTVFYVTSPSVLGTEVSVPSSPRRRPAYLRTALLPILPSSVSRGTAKPLTPVAIAFHIKSNLKINKLLKNYNKPTI
jgi:hypothetical protein